VLIFFDRGDYEYIKAGEEAYKKSFRTPETFKPTSVEAAEAGSIVTYLYSSLRESFSILVTRQLKRPLQMVQPNELYITLLVVSLLFGFLGLDDISAGLRKPIRDVTVVAHRGLARGYPENTLVAFQHALAMGVDYIEVDLRMTKDGIPIILHDPRVDRTTDGQGPVESFTLAQLKQLDAGSIEDARFAGERIPSLEEALTLVIPRGGKLLFDIKSGHDLDIQKVVRLVERHGAVKQIVIGARSVEDIRRFRSFNRDLCILAFIPKSHHIHKFAAAGADMIRLWADWISADPALIKKVYRFKKPVWVTAGLADREELAELIALGVDGILTDHPEVLMDLLMDLRKGCSR
jgi:glycerophosphoryl diester phosphodiesterase